MIWEYLVIEPKATGIPLGDGTTFQEQLSEGLNALGSKGWEYCGDMSGCMIFKRLKLVP